MARIRTIKPDPFADAEFVGLFNGEGHLDLTKSGRGRSFTPRIRIGMRDDDSRVLEWCRDRFGGSLTVRASTRSICWQLTGRAAVSEVVALLLTSRLPSKKRREALLVREAVSLIPARGAHISDASAARLAAIREELKELRRYVTGGEA